jgi:transcription antitermination factor NusG
MIHQLRQIARAARRAPAMKPANMCRIGEYVKIVSGPLYGVEGYVVRYGREASLCLNVEILGAAVEVSVSTEDIRVNLK